MINPLIRFYKGESKNKNICISCENFKGILEEYNGYLSGHLYFSGDGMQLQNEEEKWYLKIKAM